jgi:hypothetical protein
MGAPPDLTFFIWGDTHYGYEQQPAATDLRGRTIEQMNTLPGWPYPDHIGGVVGTPEFVLLCGDAVDGAEGAGASELAYFDYFSRRLRFPQIEVTGNHDLDPAYQRYFRGRYGGVSHAFDRQGVHCICLNSRYDQREQGCFGQEELDFLRDDLAQTGRDTPVMVFVHSRLDRTANGAEALQILDGYHIILVASAHIHRPALFQLSGIDCVDVGQCRNHPIDPPCGRVLYVVHVTGQRLTAVPWRWDQSGWERGLRWADAAAAVRRLTLDRELPI